MQLNDFFLNWILWKGKKPFYSADVHWCLVLLCYVILQVDHLTELVECTRLYFPKASWDKPHLCSILSERNQLNKDEVSQRFIFWCFTIHHSSFINFVQQIRDLQYNSVCKLVTSWYTKPPCSAISLFDIIINCIICWILKFLLTGKKHLVQKWFHIYNRGMVDYK